MKITKRQLKRIIKEEKAKLISEQRPVLSTDSEEYMDAYEALFDELRNAFTVAMEAGLLEDDISDAINDAREYLGQMA